MSRTLWVDITDLFHYLAHHSRPTGIQRVVLELGNALRQHAPGQVRFVRRTGGPREFGIVAWSSLEALLAAAATRMISPATRTVAPVAKARSVIEKFTPPDDPVALLADAMKTQFRVLRELAALPRGLAVETVRRTGRRRVERTEVPSCAEDVADVVSADDGFEIAAQAGDVFFVPGSPWYLLDYAETVRWLRGSLGLTFGFLIYDLVPIRHPEWCDRGVILTFTRWHRAILPLADRVFAISHATGQDVTRYIAEQKLALALPVTVIGMGSGFGHGAPPADMSGAKRMASERDLPAPGSYVLFVSTLEARKNHALLFRVWRRLLETRRPEDVPTLVFAGRVGWLVADLMQQLDNADWLNGKIRLISGVSDEELVTLYKGCQFTLFPSLFEGWGLPVTESLAFGQPCLASGTTSIPEAGGDLARYFDPEDTGDAYRAVCRVLDDPEDLRAWRARVNAEFRPVPWGLCAGRVLENFGFQKVDGPGR